MRVQEGGLLDGSSSEEEEEDEDEEDSDDGDDAFDLSAMDNRGGGGGGGGMRSEVVGDKAHEDEDDEDEDEDASDDDDEMLNLEDMDQEDDDSSEGETLEALESHSDMARPAPAAAGGAHRGIGAEGDAARTQADGTDLAVHRRQQQQMLEAQQQRQVPPAQPQQKHAPLCIKIDVEPTNRQNAGYSLMFNVEKVATGLRYGVEIKDRKTMLKVHHRCFGGPEAVDWLTQHALRAFMEKEKCDLTEPPNERLRILARSAALLLGQRLLETEVFRQINKSKGNTNVFEVCMRMYVCVCVCVCVCYVCVCMCVCVCVCVCVYTHTHTCIYVYIYNHARTPTTGRAGLVPLPRRRKGRARAQHSPRLELPRPPARGGRRRPCA